MKDGLIITATTTGIFFGLKAANVKPPKASLDSTDIMKLAGGICGGVLVMHSTKNGSTSERQYKHFKSPRGHKISICFSMVRVPLAWLTAKWATASSRKNK